MSRLQFVVRVVQNSHAREDETHSRLGLDKKRLTSFRVRRLILFWNKSTQKLLYKSENWDIEQPVSVGVNLKKCLSDR